LLTAGSDPAAGTSVRAPQDEMVTRAEFARRLRVSKPAVTQAIKAHRLHGPALATGGKMLHFRVAAAQWLANRDPQADLAPRREEDDDDGGLRDPLSSGGYRDEKAATEKVRRQLLEIELGRAHDRYRDREEVMRAEATAGRQIAQHLELIESWADVLATQTDPLAVRRLLRDMIRALRQKIADALNGLDDETPAEPAATEDSENDPPLDA
jgi:hypothetical protein